MSDRTVERQNLLLRDKLTAVIIGNSMYEGGNITGTVNSAEQLESFLKDEWHVQNVFRIETPVTREKVINKLKDVCLKLQEDEHLLLYYTGHCILGEGRGRSYLVFSDSYVQISEGKSFYHNVLSLNYLNQLLQKCKARVKVRIFDCCCSGESFSDLEDYFNNKNDLQEGVDDYVNVPEKGIPFAQIRQLLHHRFGKTSEKTVEVQKQLYGRQSGWITFCSCRLDEKAWVFPDSESGPSMPVFSYYLLKCLKMVEDGNCDGPYYIEDLKHWVYHELLEDPDHKRKLIEAEQKIGESSMIQHMQYYCSLSGNLLLKV